MRANEIGRLRDRAGGGEQDLREDPYGRAHDERRQAEDDRELRGVDPAETLTPAAGDGEPPPVEDDEELGGTERRAGVDVARPESENVGGGRERAEPDRHRLAGAAKDPDRQADHAHRDPSERARMEVSEKRVPIERSEDLRRVRQTEERGEREDRE